MTKAFNAGSALNGSALELDVGIDSASVAAPFRVSIYNPDLETVSVETAPDGAPPGATWEVLGTVATEVGSVIVTAPVPRIRVQSDGAADNVQVQIVGVALTP